MIPGPTASLTFRTRPNFSAQHLRAARYFSAEALSTEALATNDSSEKNKQVHRAYVTGAVVFAAAFLDASINEIVLEAADPGGRARFAALSDEQLAKIANISTDDSILNKYRDALKACGKENEMDCRAEPWLGARALAKLRNALMHFESEWNDDKDVRAHLERLLKDRFKLNPLEVPGVLWFPHRCLGAGCSDWPARQAADFMKELCWHLAIDRAEGK